MNLDFLKGVFGYFFIKNKIMGFNIAANYFNYIFMKKFFLFTLLVFLSVIVAGYFSFDIILKKYLISSINKKIEKKIYIEKIQTHLIQGKAKVYNLKIANKNSENFKDYLIEIKNLSIDVDILSVFREIVKIHELNLNGTSMNYKASIVDGKIIDNFNLINQYLEKNKKSEKNLKLIEDKNKKDKDEIVKNNLDNTKDKNFIIQKLKIPEIIINAEAKDLNFTKQLKIDSMEFQNVGNTKNANHFKDVFAMIATNIVIKLNNETIISNLKEKFHNKIQKILEKDELKNKLENILKDPEKKEKIFNKLNKLFK